MSLPVLKMEHICEIYIAISRQEFETDPRYVSSLSNMELLLRVFIETPGLKDIGMALPPPTKLAAPTQESMLNFSKTPAKSLHITQRLDEIYVQGIQLEQGNNLRQILNVFLPYLPWSYSLAWSLGPGNQRDLSSYRRIKVETGSIRSAKGHRGSQTTHLATKADFTRSCTVVS